MITIIGITYEYAFNFRALDRDIEAAKQRYIELLRQVQRTTAATLIGEDHRPDDSNRVKEVAEALCPDWKYRVPQELDPDEISVAELLSQELGIRYVGLEMSTEERPQYGVPEHYCQSPRRYSPEQIDIFTRKRQDFMIERFLQARIGQESALLVCGIWHVYPLAERLRERDLACNVITLVGEVSLVSTEQLPDIPDDEREIYLTWDSVWNEKGDDRPQTVIRYGDQVLFYKPANWQAIDHEYENICKILIKKYGDRLVDVTPTEKSEFWLYGDCSFGGYLREKIIERIFQPSVPTRSIDIAE